MPSHEAPDDPTQSFAALTTGTRVSHYEIIEKIGSGGMGDVYLAEDTQLDRKVALKFLPPHLCQDEDCRKRFKREAQAAAKLSHPNIIHVYEVSEYNGRPFFAMEHVEGQSLGEFASATELSNDQILELGIQISEGLHEAHEKGVTHRDIKPSNILVDLHGRVKIVDFGLATVVGSAHLTKTGSTLGTLGYMSPEQVAGEAIDHRSDLFSLGVVLYELATGQSPFKRESEAATLRAVSEDTPHPLARFRATVPEGFQAIINKALEKNVRTRYQHADGMLSDLMRVKRGLDSGISAAPDSTTGSHPKLIWWMVGMLVAVAAITTLTVTRPWTSHARPDSSGRLMIAVLPFDNLGDPDDEYFASGITEELTLRLAHLDGLGVISRTSASAVGNGSVTLPEIARQLGVDYVVEGSIRWDRSSATDHVRVTAQLIRVSDDVHLWSESYDRPLTQIFAVQTEISERIVKAMGISLGAGNNSKLTGMTTGNMDAFSDYLKGTYFMSKQTPEGFRQGHEYLVAALDKDPEFAPAWAAMSAYHTFALMAGGVSAADAYPEARAAAVKALKADSSLAESHIAMGWVHSQMEWNWTKAEGEFRRAIEISPGYSIAYLAYASLLVTMRRHEESIATMETALELDPLSPFVNQSLGWIYFLCGRSGQAIRQLHNTLELDPLHMWARAQLAWSYAAENRYAEAIGECDTILEIHQPEFDPWLIATLSSIYARGGKPERARESLQVLLNAAESTFIDPINFACLYAALDVPDSSLLWLERAFAVRSPVLLELHGSINKQRLFYGNLMSHPRFLQVMAQIDRAIIRSDA